MRSAGSNRSGRQLLTVGNAYSSAACWSARSCLARLAMSAAMRVEPNVHRRGNAVAEVLLPSGFAADRERTTASAGVSVCAFVVQGMHARTPLPLPIVVLV